MSKKTEVEGVIKRLKDIEDSIETLHAVLVLEYHDKNYLAMGTSPKRLNEDQRKLCVEAMHDLKAVMGTVELLLKK